MACDHPNLQQTARRDYCPDCGYEFYYGDAHAVGSAQLSQLVSAGGSPPDPYQDRLPAPPGLYDRYVVTKTDGTPIDPRAVYFVLRLDGHGHDREHIESCRRAAKNWCYGAPAHLRQVAVDLFEKIEQLQKEDP
jgi:hypothetical protein